MIFRAQKFCWAILFFAISTAAYSQDSLSQDSLQLPVDTLKELIVPAINPIEYANAVDSAWLAFLENRIGFLDDVKTDSTLVSLPQTSNQYKKGFETIDRLTPLNLSYNSSLDKYINEYLLYKHQLSKLLGLSKEYFPQIEQILDKHDLPLEIRNLSVIESALDPNARSYKGATGLWQFMLPTGKECGLIINSYVDERKDPVRSTEAACIYLKRLYSIYEVWELAIAAYNCGPGNVNKAIRLAGGSKNFWELRPYLPRETRKYVPKFMAMCYLMEYGELHGIRPKPVDYTFWQKDTVLVMEELRFDQIEAFTEINSETLLALNPQFKLGIIPSSEDGRTVFIPSINSSEYEANKSKFRTYKPKKKVHYVKPSVANNSSANSSYDKGEKRYYKVKSGDVLGTIAEKNGVSVSQLRRWNNIRGSRIKVGQKLVLYSSNAPKQNVTQITSNTTSNSSDKYTYHTVRKGDTLWDIAKLYSGVSPDDIKKLNKGINPNNLKMGSKLKIKKI